jgi:alkylhydroperoxidase/carboxymuconolactone decarboxylase family protein YurZ
VTKSVGDLIESIEEHRAELAEETAENPAGQAGSADLQAITRHLNSIGLAIEHCEAAALDRLQELERYLAGALSTLDTGGLKHHLERFDFDAAGRELEAIRHALHE